MATIILTRRPGDNAPLKARLVAAGLDVIEAPCLDVAPIAPAAHEQAAVLDGPTPADVIAFASKNGVDGYVAWLESLPENQRPDWPAFVATVGPGTAARLLEHGQTADLIAEPATGQALAEALMARMQPARILAVRGTTSRDAAGRILAAAGWTVMPLTVYENREPVVPTIETTCAAVLFASPLSASRFYAANPGQSARPVAIGTTTADWLREHGREPLVAVGTDVDALTEALLAAAQGARITDDDSRSMQ